MRRDGLEKINGKPDIFRLTELGDGLVRERLLRIGMSRRMWEAASPDTRQTVRDALRAMEVLEKAAFIAVAGSTPDVHSSAAKLLGRMVSLLNRDARDPNGFQRRKAKAVGHLVGASTLRRLEMVLDTVKEEARQVRRERTCRLSALEPMPTEPR